MKHQNALILLIIFNYVLKYDYFVFSDTELSFNLSTTDKFFKKSKNYATEEDRFEKFNPNLVCDNNLNNENNLTISKCFNATLSNNETSTELSSLISEEEITTELYNDELIQNDDEFNEEDLNEDEDDYLLNDFKEKVFNYNSSFVESLSNYSVTTETNNLTRIQPITKLIPVDPFKGQNNQIIEFDWDLDPAEDKHKWHHKKKKKKKHHHKKKKHIHHHWHWKSKKKCDHHHWHKHKHKEKHKHKHWEKHKHKKEAWHKHKEWHKEKHKEWHKHKHKHEGKHKHKHEGKHKHDHSHKSKHKHSHKSKHHHHKKKKKKKKGW